MLQRLGEILVATLQLLEEADILDGDDGLVGEGRDELDLLVGEGLDLGSSDHDHTDYSGFPEHRDSQDRTDLGALLPRPSVLRICHDIVDVHDPPLENRPSRRGPSLHHDGIRLDDLENPRAHPVGGRRAIVISVLPVDEPKI